MFRRTTQKFFFFNDFFKPENVVAIVNIVSHTTCNVAMLCIFEIVLCANYCIDLNGYQLNPFTS